MRKICAVIVFLSVCAWLNIHSGYAQPPAAAATAMPETKSVDVNKDGKPDVTYYRQGKYVSKIEADTNYDGKPDVTVRLKDGKFDSAEADTNYDGKAEKKFTNASDFNKWVNSQKPSFKDKLNRPDWQFDALKF
jgi:hypothetical protein